MPHTITPSDALLVVDMQNDFMPGGTLAVSGGDEIIPLINRLLAGFSTRVFTRDWHPLDHTSFAVSPAFKDGSWPAHCVQGTRGAEFHPDLESSSADKLVSKAEAPDKEAYSGFQDTDLAQWLEQRNIQRIFVTGVAMEYCVKATALDALRAGFEVWLIQDAVRGVNLSPGSEEKAVQIMQAAGVNLTSSRELI